MPDIFQETAFGLSTLQWIVEMIPKEISSFSNQDHIYLMLIKENWFKSLLLLLGDILILYIMYLIYWIGRM